MMNSFTKYQKGAATMLFLIVVAMVLTLLLAATQSRLLLSLRRSQSAADFLLATYQAESEVNDVMARLAGGYLASANIPRTTKHVGDMRIEIEGQETGGTQIVTVTTYRGYAVGKVQATRRVSSVSETNEVELILMLDCTGSMDNPSGLPGQTRFDAQKDASIDFVTKLAGHETADKFKLGVGVFGVEAGWLKYSGTNVTPNSGMSFSQIVTAIEQGFGSTRSTSPACQDINTHGTNVGVAFKHPNEYLFANRAEGKKQIEIVITDGEPNTSTSDSQCLVVTTCLFPNPCDEVAKNYLRCTLADSSTFVSAIGQNGVRDPNVDAYAVTVLDSPPPDVVGIFQNYATTYFNVTNAYELSGILDNILTKILEDRSTITIKRVIPEPI